MDIVPFLDTPSKRYVTQNKTLEDSIRKYISVSFFLRSVRQFLSVSHFFVCFFYEVIYNIYPGKVLSICSYMHDVHKML